MSEYRTHDVPVRGGDLRVGAWHPDGPVERVVLAVHGITATHRSWALVAPLLASGTLVLAPDLRGRGRSGSLPAPAGMVTHAQDCQAVLTEMADGHCDLAMGHSMGGFVVATLAGTAPDTVGALLLVDGGVPFPLPDGVDLETAMTAGLGPAVARLSMAFDTREAYRDFWRDHPALVDDWNDAVVDYVDYDLDPDARPFRSSVSAELITADYRELFAAGPVDAAWRTLRQPTTFLRAPRGLLNEAGGLYPPALLDAWTRDHSNFAWTNVDDVNHYTITLGPDGASDVATAAGR